MITLLNVYSPLENGVEKEKQKEDQLEQILLITDNSIS